MRMLTPLPVAVVLGSLSACFLIAADCDENGRDDAEEIATGRAVDEDKNGVPDKCEAEFWFLLGDADQNHRVQITDAIFLLRYLVVSGLKPPCLKAADANRDGVINLADPITILNHLFRRPTRLPERCGAHYSPGPLTCEINAECFI